MYLNIFLLISKVNNIRTTYVQTFMYFNDKKGQQIQNMRSHLLNRQTWIISVNFSVSNHCVLFCVGKGCGMFKGNYRLLEF